MKHFNLKRPARIREANRARRNWKFRRREETFLREDRRRPSFSQALFYRTLWGGMPVVQDLFYSFSHDRARSQKDVSLPV